ncbi:MAG: hypothetical protein GX319_05770 [Clostridiales bacterium]|nr:hypothetical protein [Bacillota bacterium]NLK03902.1 hypothetical protein [Clostridiales bacterium]
MVLKRKKIILLATIIIVTAIAVALFVGFLSSDEKTEYEGTLVDIGTTTCVSL